MKPGTSPSILPGATGNKTPTADQQVATKDTSLGSKDTPSESAVRQASKEEAKSMQERQLE